MFLHNWCSIHNVKFRDNDDLILKQQIIDRYQKEVEKHNQDLGHTEQIKVFRLVADEWTPDNGMLSPTQKLKRKKVIGKYVSILDEIYEKN